MLITPQDAILFPLRVATSPVLLRTYLRSLLLVLTSTILFAFAVVAYSSFYYTYIPVRGISVPVYLQFDHGATSPYISQTDGTLGGSKLGKWPYGLANIPGLVDRQKYDVVVELSVPRSDTNLRAGNWMIGLEFRGPSRMGRGVKQLLGWDEEWSVGDYGQDGAPGATSEKLSTKGSTFTTASETPTVLARGRRPVLLTYRSWSLEHAHRLLRLPLYLLGWHTESENVEVGMMESIMFEPGYRNIPTSLRLELRSRLPLEVYSASVRISARLEGIRWLMYRYWFSSAVVGILAFWGMEMGVLLVTWAGFTILSSSSTPHEVKKEEEETKREEDGEEEPGTPFSNTSRTFPTLPSQQPLSYHSPSPKEEPQSPPNIEDIPTREEQEADDEDDDYVLEEPIHRNVEREGVFTDSGLGTSLESSVERGLARRRSGGQGDGFKGGREY
jgi:seipin